MSFQQPCLTFNPLLALVAPSYPTWEAEIVMTGNCVPNVLQNVLYALLLLITGGLSWVGIIATILRVRREPKFKQMIGFKIVVAASSSLFVLSLNFLLLYFGLGPFFSPALYGLSIELANTHNSLTIYSLMTLLDGVALTSELRKQIQEMSERLKKQTIYGRAIGFTVAMTLWILSSVLHAQGQIASQILCCAGAISVSNLSIIATMFSLKKHGTQLVNALKQNATQQEKYATDKSDKTQQLNDITQKIEMGRTNGINVLASSLVFSSALVLWMIICVFGGYPLAYINIVMMCTSLIFSPAGLFINIYIHAIKAPKKK